MKPIRKLLYYVKPYWKLSILALLLLTSVVFMDLAIPRLIQRIIDQGIKGHDQSIVLQTAFLMLGFSLLSALFAVGNNIASVRVGEGVARDLREAIFLKIQDFSHGNFDHFTTGKLIVRLTSDTSAVQRLVQISLRIGTRAPMLMVGSLILMVTTNRQLALSILPLLLVTSAAIVLFSIKMESLFRIVQQKLDRLNTVLQENITGVRLVKAFVRADHESQRFNAANEDFTYQSERVLQYMTAMMPVLTIFVNAGIVIVIYFGGQQAIRGDLSVGQIVAFTNYLLTTMTPLIMMTMLSNIWANGLASWQRMSEVLETTPEVQDGPAARLLPTAAPGQLAFENVSFHYNGSGSGTVLEDISFTAEPGETIAILGATGAGKSTLANLVPRFYDVSGGRVLIDGYDLRDLRQESLLEQIGVVPQETTLFSGSVAENIRYGRPEASDEEVIAAAQAAQADEFIQKLPAGYNTHVEERGTNLSGGQKQRIAIARALLMKPRFLILDDSTSSVDVETEAHIQSALDNQIGDCTRIVVAQRISTVLNADKILVIDRGRIVAQGTHSELIESSPIYREIYASQLGNGIPGIDLLGSDSPGEAVQPGEKRSLSQ